MKYVLDSCVAFKWGVREADTDKALQLLAGRIADLAQTRYCLHDRINLHLGTGNPETAARDLHKDGVVYETVQVIRLYHYCRSDLRPRQEISQA